MSKKNLNDINLISSVKKIERVIESKDVSFKWIKSQKGQRMFVYDGNKMRYDKRVNSVNFQNPQGTASIHSYKCSNTKTQNNESVCHGRYYLYFDAKENLIGFEEISSHDNCDSFIEKNKQHLVIVDTSSSENFENESENTSFSENSEEISMEIRHDSQSQKSCNLSPINENENIDFAKPSCSHDEYTESLNSIVIVEMKSEIVLDETVPGTSLPPNRNQSIPPKKRKFYYE